MDVCMYRRSVLLANLLSKVLCLMRKADRESGGIFLWSVTQWTFQWILTLPGDYYPNMLEKWASNRRKLRNTSSPRPTHPGERLGFVGPALPACHSHQKLLAVQPWFRLMMMPGSCVVRQLG